MSDFKYITVKMQIEPESDDIISCEDCGVTTKTSDIFRIVRSEYDKVEEWEDSILLAAYCEKHIVEHLEEDIKKFIKDEAVEE